LNETGTTVSHVPFDRFHRAGWSKAGPDVLDPARIAVIRLGWGGHPGAANETIEFTVRAPESFRLGAAP
jgi:hypothetical protein